MSCTKIYFSLAYPKIVNFLIYETIIFNFETDYNEVFKVILFLLSRTRVFDCNSPRNIWEIPSLSLYDRSHVILTEASPGKSDRSIYLFKIH